MKEFMLIPTNQVKNYIKDGKNDNISVITKESVLPEQSLFTRDVKTNINKNNILENGSMQSDVVLDLYNYISKLHDEKQKNKITMNDVKQEEKPKINIQQYVNTLPKSFRQVGIDLLNEMKSTTDILDNGNIKLKTEDSELPIEDFLRAVLIKNARVSHIKDELLKFLPEIPVFYRYNAKLMNMRGGVDEVNTVINKKKHNVQWLRI